jgi:lactate dehydrogenase-like 2-hydroxyacid dehydrogenase
MRELTFFLKCNREFRHSATNLLHVRGGKSQLQSLLQHSASHVLARSRRSLCACQAVPFTFARVKETLSMTKPILVVTSRYPKEVEDRINQDYNARRNPNQFPFNQQDLLSATEGADALFITPADRLDSGFFRNVSPSIKIIATYSVGFEHIDLEAAARRKIPIAYTPGVNSEATADIAMLLLLGASRRAYEAQELVRTGAWKPLSPDMLLGWQVGGKVLGILGMGRVGQAVARRARGFGMRIHYCNVSELPAEIAGDAVYHKNSSDLLRASQFLSLHAPETAQTRHFLNAKTISLLPPGAIVVNTARGGLVVDDDLIAALKNGRVAAAGLDVFEGEPNLNPEYISLKNTYLLPHIGSATIETRTAMGMLALDNVEAVLNGKPAPTLVQL